MSDNYSADKKSITTAQDTMDTIKESVLEIIGRVKHGERTTIKDITDKVVAETGIQISIATGIIPMIIHEWAQEGNGTVNNGRGGGVFPGGKPVKIDTRPRCDSCHQVLRPKKQAE